MNKTKVLGRVGRGAGEPFSKRVSRPAKKNSLSENDSPPADPRRDALSVLLALEKGGTTQALLDRVLRAAGGDRRHGALCTELVYGFLRTERRLDAVLRQLLRRPEKLPREMFLALGMAAYALLFLDRVPAHATVDWTVRQVRARFGEGLARVANGTLRSLQRLGDGPATEEFYASRASDPLRRAALFYSVPDWMALLWDRVYGREACLHLLRRSFDQPHPCVRVNARHERAGALRAALLEHGGEAVGAWGVAFAPGSSPDTVLDAPLECWMDAGVCSRQAAGSQSALSMLRPGEWSQPIWDACAGQGGKTLALLERGSQVALCSDVHGGRLRGLRDGARRLGLKAPPVIRAAADQPPLRRWAGTILLDVPCSGLGTLSRRPEIRRRRGPEDVRHLAALQARIAAAAWKILRPGGHLVYMTCTLHPEENERQVAALRRAHSDVQCLDMWQTPHEHPWMEGMYAALLRKQG